MVKRQSHLEPELGDTTTGLFLALDVTDKVEVARDLLKAKLPKYNYILLKEVIQFLDEVGIKTLDHHIEP